MITNNEMKVIKRNGRSENILFDKILNRVKKLGLEHGIYVNYTTLVMKVIEPNRPHQYQRTILIMVNWLVY
jgi:hypothetical protein